MVLLGLLAGAPLTAGPLEEDGTPSSAEAKALAKIFTINRAVIREARVARQETQRGTFKDFAATTQAQDAELRVVLGEMLPPLQRHLVRAQELQTRLGPSPP
jgi:hypothetical protein